MAYHLLFSHSNFTMEDNWGIIVVDKEVIITKVVVINRNCFIWEALVTFKPLLLEIFMRISQ